jgi:acetyltransferase
MPDTLSRGGIRPLVFPRSLAVIGASPTKAQTVESILRSGIPAWGVNPGRTDVLGLPCVASVADIPETPETALLLVSHARVEEAFEEAAAAGVRAFILPGLGSEAGALGPAIAASIAARASELDAAILGPNCMGVAAPGAASAWIGTVPETVAVGHVSAVSQSGSIGEALLGLGPRIGFRCVVSCGGEMARDAADFLAFLADDEETRAIGLFLETVRRPAAFKEALARCAEVEKPVACLKVGRSPAASRVALAHTGALVGSARAFSAVLRSYGAIEVDDFPELVETLEVLGRKRRPRGLRIGAISESGGEGALLADRAQEAGIPFAPLPEPLVAKLRESFPNYLAPSNPLDAWAVDEVDRVYPGSLELMARSGAFDMLLAQIDLSQFRGRSEQEWCLLVMRALADCVEGTGIFPAITSVQTADPPRAAAEFARERDLALLRGPRNATRALAAVARWRPILPPPVDGGGPAKAALTGGGPLPEHESALLLERYGVRFAPRRRADSPEEAAEAAAALGLPVVVKVDGPAHKRRAGGVVLGIDSPDAAAAAARRLGAPVLVAREIPAGPEAFCGMTRDPDFGPVLAIGPGGAEVESVDRVLAALAPIDLPLARELVEAAGLTGNHDALAETLVALGQLAIEHNEILEIDVNPLILSEDGAIAVDALVVVKRGDPA